jgi:hypothetical protein
VIRLPPLPPKKSGYSPVATAANALIYRLRSIPVATVATLSRFERLRSAVRIKLEIKRQQRQLYLLKVILDCIYRYLSGLPPRLPPRLPPPFIASRAATGLRHRKPARGSALTNVMTAMVGDGRRLPVSGVANWALPANRRSSPILRAYCTDTALNTAIPHCVSVQSIAYDRSQRIMNPLVWKHCYA